MEITTRKAQATDVDWLLGELKEFAVYIRTKKHSLFGDEEYSRKGLLGVIENHVMFIAVKGEERLGFIAGIKTPHLFNPKISILVEIFWWVSEKYRNTRAGLMLLNSFTEYGKQNADLVTMALEAHSPVNDKTITKRGYHFHEKNYLMEV